MAIALASKFESLTSDLLKAARKTKELTNSNWSWDGVNAINVYTLVDPVIGTYDPTAVSNRYGTPSEVQDTIQTFTLLRDRAWTKTIDKKNYQDTMMIRKPGKYLAQATKNVLIPEIDTYILQTIATAGFTANRHTIVAAGGTTAVNAYENFLTLNAKVTDDEAPVEGRKAVMTATYYNFLKQGGFVLDSDSAYRDRKSGNLGQVDGVDVIIVPANRMPGVTITTLRAVDLLITHPNATCAPEKLVDYTLHKNAPGYSGDLLEYRHRYDAFVDTNLVKEIALHAGA